MTTTADSTSTYRPMGREPEYPAFPHLPADIQHALADFDARVADGRLPMAADGYPAIPVAAEAWVADFLHAHLPTGIYLLPHRRAAWLVGAELLTGAAASAEIEMRRDDRLEPVGSALRSYAEALPQGAS